MRSAKLIGAVESQSLDCGIVTAYPSLNSLMAVLNWLTGAAHPDIKAQPLAVFLSEDCLSEIAFLCLQSDGHAEILTA